MVFLFVIFLLHFLLGQLIEVFRLKILAGVLAALLVLTVYFFTLGLSYTADYHMYRLFFKYEFPTDLLIMQLTNIFKGYRLSFHHLFVFHIAASVLICFIFIRKYTINFFYVFLAYVLIDYVHFANQIRFYLGVPLVMLSFYYLLKKKYFQVVLFALLGCLSHIGLLLVVLFIPVYYFVKKERYLKVMLLLSLLCFSIIFIGLSLGIGSDVGHFGNYFEKDLVSSVVGGFYNAIPYILFLTVLYRETNVYLKKNPDAWDDPKFNLLYKLTFYTVIFVPASLYLQIIGHRYVMPFVMIYTIFYLYMIRHDLPRLKSFKLAYYSLLCFIVCTIIYVIPSYIMKENHFLDEFELMMKSIKYINYKEW